MTRTIGRLLDWFSRANAVAEASGVRPASARRKLRLPRKHTWEAHIHISMFISFFNTGAYMGAKISKRYFSHSYRITSTKLYDKYISHRGI